MAKATINRLVPMPPPIESVTLVLTEAEAVTLKYLVSCVQGDWVESYRVYTDNILTALERSGIENDTSYSDSFFKETVTALRINARQLKIEEK